MKFQLTLAVALIATFSAFGQTCPCQSEGSHLIVVDFKNRTVTTPGWKQDHYNQGDKVSICVTNCNPYLYRVLVNGTDSNQVPPAMGAVFSWLLDPTNLSSIVSAAAANPLAGTEGMPSLTQQETKNYTKSINLRANGFTSTIRNYFINHQGTPPDPLAALKQASNDFFKQYIDLITKRSNEITTINNNIQTAMYTLAGETDFLYQNNTDDATLHKDYIGDLKNTYQTQKAIVDSKIGEIRTDQLQYFNDMSAFSDLYDKNKLLKTRDSLLGSFFASSISLLNKMDSTLSISEVLRRKPALLQLQALSTNYISLPQFYLKDVKDITISIAPWSDSASKLPSYSTTVELPVYHHFRFGAGVGFYVSGLGNRQYAIDSSIVTNSAGNPDTTYKIQADGKNRMEFGVSALVYGGWCIGGKFYLGPSIGTGVSLSGTIRPRLFIGPTLVYGESNQIMVTVGWALGQSQTVSSVFSNFSQSYGSLPTNFTKNAISNGFYVSVHYSFLNQ
jgi:hypothetical protein